MALQHLTAADFDAAVDAAPAAVVDFWAEWCGPCRMMGPVMEELAARCGGRALVAKVNVDENPELARRFAVELIPTVVFLKQGREFHRSTGVVPVEALLEALDRA